MKRWPSVGVLLVMVVAGFLAVGFGPAATSAPHAGGTGGGNQPPARLSGV